MATTFDLKELRKMSPFEELIKHYENSEDSSHGITHIENVLNEAAILSSPQPTDVKESVLYGALLHDIDREKDYKNSTDRHEITGVATARKYLNSKANHLTYQQKNDILEAVRNHRSSTASKNLGITAKLVSDADRLAVSYKDMVRRAYEYRLANGADSDSALRDGYWYLRNRKLKSMSSLGNNLYLDESKRRHAEKIEEFKELTKTFKDYQLLLGIKEPKEFLARKGDLNTMTTKRAWLEAAVPSLGTSPATAKLLERAARIAVRKEYREAVTGSPDSNSTKEVVPVQPVSGTWKDVT